MNKVGNISVKKTSYDDSFLNSRLELNINGNDIDHIVVNTLRRICLTNIPVYIYDKFDFVENTSIFNNNYIKLRFRNIPVLGIETSSAFYNEPKESLDQKDNISEMLNMDDISLETDLAPLAFANLIESIGSKNVTVNYDTGNSAALGYDPDEEFEYEYSNKVTDIVIDFEDFLAKNFLPFNDKCVLDKTFNLNYRFHDFIKYHSKQYEKICKHVTEYNNDIDREIEEENKKLEEEDDDDFDLNN